MRRRTTLFVALIVLALAVAGPAAAKRPLGGDMKLYFNLGFGVPGAPCPSVPWAGTVDLDGAVYGIAFYADDARDVGVSHHFREGWKVFNEPFSFTGGVLAACASGGVVMVGTDSGVGTLPNTNFHMSGHVTDAAGPFADWLGRFVYIEGGFTPDTAHGTFRLN